MHSNTLKSHRKMSHALDRSRRPGLTAIALGLALAITGCVSSTEPILSDGKGILGSGGQLHLYDLEEGGPRNPRTDAFQWNGRHYTTRGRPVEVSDFTVHAYEGRDLIVQARVRRPLRPYVYGLARKLEDGVYVVTTIDPNDADEGARNRFCVKTRDAPCRIETPEQLFVFARATAARDRERGKLAVLVRAPKR
jgi:hypothetical protein